MMQQPREHLESKIWTLERRVEDLEIALAELLASQEQMLNEKDPTKVMNHGFRLTNAVVKAKRLLID